MLVLNNKQVAELLTYDRCIESMRQVMKAVSAGEAVQPMRQMIRLPQKSAMMGWMPGFATLDDSANSEVSTEALGVKLISVFPVEGVKGRTAHQGVVVLFDSEQGGIKGVLEAGEITAIRTPCATAVATKALARKDSKTLAILGSGEQARGHLEALLSVVKLEKIVIWSQTPERAQALKNSQPDAIRNIIEIADSVELAVAGADIVCTTTSAAEPILKYRWLKPGAHVNVVGSSVPFTSEVDIETVSQSRFFVDHKETVRTQGGEYLRAIEAAAIDEDHIEAEVGEVLSGENPGRRANDEITVYKSVGIVAYDLAAAALVYEQASARNIGKPVSLLATP